jgi:hypothetical protein
MIWADVCSVRVIRSEASPRNHWAIGRTARHCSGWEMWEGIALDIAGIGAHNGLDRTR